jgi:hypothetical protein
MSWHKLFAALWMTAINPANVVLKFGGLAMAILYHEMGSHPQQAKFSRGGRKPAPADLDC